MAIRTLTQLRQTPQPDWVWQGYALPSNFTLLAAAYKTGKTTFLFHLIKAVMRGEPFLELDTRPVPVYYISEEPDTLLAQRAEALGIHESWNIGWTTLEPGLRWANVIGHIKEAVRHWGNPLIIIDTLPRFWDVADEWDPVQVDRALRPLFDILRTTQAALIGTHHLRKSGGTHGMAVRGSTALGGAVDIILEMWRINPFDSSSKRRLDAVSRYGDTPQEMQIELRNGVYVVRDSAVVELERSIVELLADREHITVKEVMEELFIGERYAQQALAGLHNRGLLVRNGRGGRTGYTYSLAVETRKAE